MQIKIGGFVLQVYLTELYVMIPRVGELYWNAVHGLAMNRA